LIDHFGLLGTARLPVTGPQIIGGGMLLAGTFIVIHFKNPG